MLRQLKEKGKDLQQTEAESFDFIIRCAKAGQNAAQETLDSLVRSGRSVDLCFHGRTPYQYLLEEDENEAAFFLANHWGATEKRKQVFYSQDRSVLTAILNNTSATDLLQQFAPYQKGRALNVINLIYVAAYAGEYAVLEEIIKECDLSKKFGDLIIKTVIGGAARAGHDSVVRELLADKESIKKGYHITAIKEAAQGAQLAFLSYLMQRFPGQEKIAIAGLIKEKHLTDYGSALRVFSFIPMRTRIILLDELKKQTSLLKESKIDFNVLQEQLDSIEDIRIRSAVGFNEAKMCASNGDSYYYLLTIKKEDELNRPGLPSEIVADYLAPLSMNFNTLARVAHAHAQPSLTRFSLSKERVTTAIQEYKKYKNSYFGFSWCRWRFFTSATSVNIQKELIEETDDIKRYQAAEKYLARNESRAFAKELLKVMK